MAGSGAGRSIRAAPVRRVILFVAVMTAVYGQNQSPRAAAPVDLTGYWVSVVTEDWRYRMVTPKKGDYPSIPLNAAGRKVADAWDPAKDDPCKAFGAANIMRQPGRIHITCYGDTRLKLE